MTMRFMMNGGTTHRINTTAPVHCQALRIWGSISGLTNGSGVGLMAPGNVNSSQSAATPTWRFGTLKPSSRSPTR